MRVERLPFTVYDIVGYLIPGTVMFFGLWFLVQGSASSWLFVEHEAEKLSVLGSTLALSLVLIVSYVLGHISALFSAHTVEKLVLGFTGYPSQFLVNDYNFGEKDRFRRQIFKNRSRKIRQAPWVIFIYLPFLPYSLFLEIFERANLFKHIIKPIKLPMVVFDKKFEEEFSLKREILKNSEWFSLVHSFVVYNNFDAASKMYNYVTMYGFCRNLSFVFYVLGCGVFIRAFCPIPILPSFASYVLWAAMFLTAGVALLLLGFTKFWRRYSEEALNAFISTRKAAS